MRYALDLIYRLLSGKKKALLAITAVCCLFCCAAARADHDTAADVRIAQTASHRAADCVVELSEGWKFGGMNTEAYEVDYDDSLWSAVNLPHTWNAQDAATGDSKYTRAAYWYRKTVDIGTDLKGKRVYMEFLGANQSTDLYVNGLHARLSGTGLHTHKGGYTAFRYDVTNLIHPGSNVLAIRVDNRYSEEIAPLSADFNMYGGIYKRVYMITVDELHFDLSDYGSSGLFLTTPNARSKERPANLGALNIRADIVNDGGNDRRVTVIAHIDGDNAPVDISRTFTVPAGSFKRFETDTRIIDPHLWQGIDYSGARDNSDVGYCYTVTVTILENGKVIDTVSDKVGFRYFYVDKETGFYLNGEPHPLRGVNRHQFMLEQGSAVKESVHDEDIRLIMELGANAIRLSHYPQTDYFYDLCDQYGIVVWTEIPLVNNIGKAETFMEVTKTQLIELIRQQYNRPSICFWGLENEVRNEARNPSYTVKELLAELNMVAHREDPYGRYTTQAVNTDIAMDGGDASMLLNDSAEVGWRSDLIAWNIYPGWYSKFKGTFEELVVQKTSNDSRPMGLSEYGWGASVEQHELYPVLGKNDLSPTGKWHPEEYQSLMHEQAVKSINAHDELWAAFIWCMFDFDVDSRNEGSRAAQNDKGLVTNDRTIKKDSFYLYKANWDQREPFVYITGSHYAERKESETYVKVYSNCEEVELFHNGTSLGLMRSQGDGIFIIDYLSLSVGENKMTAVGVRDRKRCEDTCVWMRAASNSVDLYSDAFTVNLKERTVAVPYAVRLGEFRSMLLTVNNGVYTVQEDGVELTDEDALVHAGMTVSVQSESRAKKAVYTVIPENLASTGKMWALSYEKSNKPANAVDGSKSTRWTAMNNAYPQAISVQFNDIYTLTSLTIDWDTKGDRYYGYTIEVSENGTDYVTVVDRSDNKHSGTTYDDLRMVRGKTVRVNVLSCNQWKGYASIYEMRLEGWSFSSPVYEIDHENKLIVVPNPESLTPELLQAQLLTRGNCTIYILAEADKITEGTPVVLADARGRQIPYTVTARKDEARYATDLALFKPVYRSSEEGVSGNGADTHAACLNDGRADTAWVAMLAPAKGKGKNKSRQANYPEWVGIDLGRLCEISEIELLFEKKDGRVYQFQVLASTQTPLVNGEDIPAGYSVIIDQQNNKTYTDGLYTFSVDHAKARYIVIKVLGNSTYPKIIYTAAGIYDCKVIGTECGE